MLDWRGAMLDVEEVYFWITSFGLYLLWCIAVKNYIFLSHCQKSQLLNYCPFEVLLRSEAAMTV